MRRPTKRWPAPRSTSCSTRNALYLDEIAREIAAELEPLTAPPALLRHYAVLVRSKGAAVTSEDVHDAWVAWIADIDPDHSALRPFAELDEPVRRADEPFRRAVRAVASRRARGG